MQMQLAIMEDSTDLVESYMKALILIQIIGKLAVDILFVAADQLAKGNLSFTLDIDGQRQQTGDTGDMLNPIVPLIAHMSTQFTLLPGDVVLTGTPKGVGPLVSGQTLSLELEDVLFVETTVV